MLDLDTKNKRPHKKKHGGTRQGRVEITGAQPFCLFNERLHISQYFTISLNVVYYENTVLVTIDWDFGGIGCFGGAPGGARHGLQPAC